MTRVAKLDPDLWTELFLDNADYLTGEMRVLIQGLNAYLAALESGDADTLRTLLQEGRARKLTAGGD